MSPRSIGLSDQLYAYLIANAVREAEPLRRLREETAKLEQAQMQVAPEQGQLLALLVRLIDARRTLEIGTFTGYSAMAVALALPDDGRLVACENDANYAAIAERHWRAAGVAHKIELKLAPALETLDRLLAGGARDAFDMTFIDADKENYQVYYERCLRVVRRGGLILIDNMLWNGWVADPDDRKPSTEAIRELTRKVHADPRVDSALVPIGDGLLIARRSA